MLTLNIVVMRNLSSDKINIKMISVDEILQPNIYLQNKMTRD